jgi:hypothetical protein
VSGDRLEVGSIAREDRCLLMARCMSDEFDEFDDDMTSHTNSRMTGHMTVIARVSGRRFWTVNQKLGTSKNPSHLGV